jgi:hypothetical protein
MFERHACRSLEGGLKTLEDQLKDVDGQPSSAVQSALWHLAEPLVRNPERGSGPIGDDKSARLTLRAAALLLHSGTRSRAKNLAALVDTEERAERTLLQIVRKHFEVPAFEFM